MNLKPQFSSPSSLSSNRGASFVEVLIATGVIAVSAFALIAGVHHAMKSRQDEVYKTQLFSIKDNLIANFSNPLSITRTKAHGDNATPMDCIIPAHSSCTGVRELVTVALSDGSTYLEKDITTGFQVNGEPCTGFVSTGNDACPIRVDVYWRPVCPTTDVSCLGGSVNTIQIEVEFQVKPTKPVSFSPDQENFSIRVGNY